MKDILNNSQYLQAVGLMEVYFREVLTALIREAVKTRSKVNLIITHAFF